MVGIKRSRKHGDSPGTKPGFIHWPSVYQLVRKDVLIEYRQRFSLFTVLLYALSTAYLTYLAFTGAVDPPVYNALLWIILVFAAMVAAGRSFTEESGRSFLFYHSLSAPQNILMGKLLFNILYMGLLSFITLFIFFIFFDLRVHSPGLFCLNLLIGSAGFSAVLTMTAGIASRTRNNPALLSVLSLPLLLPVLLLSMRASLQLSMGMGEAESIAYLWGNAALAVLIILLALLLFPYLWRD